MRRHPILALAALVAGTTLALAGCNDEPLTPAPHDAAVASLAAPELLDPGIDPNDTYLVAEATTQTTTTIEYPQPTFDPATGGSVSSVSLPPATETVRTEAGYDAGGTIRINTYYEGAESDGADEVARVLVAGDSVTYFDAAGAPRPDLPGRDLIATLGSFADDVVTDSIILADVEMGVAYAASLAVADAAGAPLTPATGAVAALEADGETMVRETSLDDEAAGTRGRRLRTYRRQGAAWVLAEERVESRSSRLGVGTTLTQVTRYRDVRWRNVADRDANRRARKAARGPADGAASASLAAYAGTRMSYELDTEQLDGTDDATSPDGSAPSTGEAGTSGSGSLPLGPLKPGAFALNVGFAHGALSDASAWTPTQKALDVTFDLGVVVKPNLRWRSSLESQARDFHGQLAATGADNFLLFGHSNGGLVARRAAQLGAPTPSLVSGVFAISAPHAGMPLAQVARETVGAVITAELQRVVLRIGGSCWRGQFSWLCEYADEAANDLVPRVVEYAFDNLMPAAQDLRPGSPFLTTLDTTPESFRSYSIETASQGRWKFVRLLGDWQCGFDSSCSGNRLQNLMESAYQILRYCGSNEIAKAKLSFSDKCRDVRWILSSLDVQYERWTAPGDESDGIVPMKSQAYPGSSVQRFVRRNAKESHAGELKSARVHTSIVDAVKAHRGA